MKPYIQYWLEHFLKHAEPVTTDKPLVVGWCVYVEGVDWD